MGCHGPITSWQIEREKVEAAAAKLLQSCLILCDPIDGSPPGSTVPGILQARTLEWVAISFSNACKWQVKVKSLSRVRLSDAMDCSLQGYSVHGIFQARVLERVAIAFSEVEAVTGFTFLCSKITVYSDLSHETRRLLLLGRKAMTNLDNVLKKRDVSLPTKFWIVKAMKLWFFQ